MVKVTATVGYPPGHGAVVLQRVRGPTRIGQVAVVVSRLLLALCVLAFLALLCYHEMAYK